MIDRYDTVGKDWDRELHPDGAVVLYEDHAADRARLVGAIEEIAADLETLRARLRTGEVGHFHTTSARTSPTIREVVRRALARAERELGR